MLAIALGIILLIFAAFTILRPNKPTEPPDSDEPSESSVEPLEHSGR